MTLNSDQEAGLEIISTHVRKCLKTFQQACTAFGNARSEVASKLSSSSIDNEVGRFRIWSGNCAAHRQGKASLDYKLREASHIRERVLRLLESLSVALQDMIDILTEKKVPWEDLSDSEGEVDGESPFSDLCETTELGQLASEIADINTYLMRLSVVVRNPVPHERFKTSRQMIHSYPESVDVNHVQAKFSAALPSLITRLGVANSRRRQYLNYRQTHREKLEHGLDMPENTDTIHDTEASSLPSVLAPDRPSFQLPDIVFDQADDLQTTCSFSEHDSTGLRPPTLPDAGRDGQPFECPVCFRFVSEHSDAAYHKHIYQDLQPYMCTYASCKTPDCTYESRREWFRHETEMHWKRWECVNDCNEIFFSHESIRAHVQREHPYLAQGGLLDAVVRSCERQRPFVGGTKCPLCLREVSTPEKYRSHVGGHFEDLALFVLPSHVMDSVEAEEDDAQDEEANLQAGEDPASGQSTSSNDEYSSGFTKDFETSDLEHLSYRDPASNTAIQHDRLPDPRSQGQQYDPISGGIHNLSQPGTGLAYPSGVYIHDPTPPHEQLISSSNKELTNADQSSESRSTSKYGPVQCSACGLQFSGRYAKGNLRRHVANKHAENGRKCRMCDKVFNRADACRKHEWKAHQVS